MEIVYHQSTTNWAENLVNEEIPKNKKTIVVVLKGYPRLSETFIAQEIRELELRGFQVVIFSLRHPYDPDSHPIHGEIEAQVNYLPEYLRDSPGRIARSLLACLRKPGFAVAIKQCFKDWCRDRTRNRLRRFGQALVLASEAPNTFYYAHFMHTPASVAYYAATINQCHWAISAHAKDIWTLQDWEKQEKLQSADWLVTCTRANFLHLHELAADPKKVNLVYHGIDLNRFSPPESPTPPVSQQDDFSGVTLLSVGRAVEKKGYQYLLEALATLPDSCDWRLVHIGGGEMLSQFKAQAVSLKLDTRIEWMGPQPQASVLLALQQADLFVLPSIVGNDGDRDGLPNVLMEAQSQQLACLATDISGIPELITHGVNGWLVPQRDTGALKEALMTLITDNKLRKALAREGLENVTKNFSHKSCIDTLVTLLQR